MAPTEGTGQGRPKPERWWDWWGCRPGTPLRERQKFIHCVF